MENHLKHWKLVNKEPVECGLLEWAEFFEFGDRYIKNTQFPLCWVSTVFMGIDHNFYYGPEENPPLLFDSMIFEGSLDGEQWRYATYKEAEEGHEQLEKMAEKSTQERASDIMIWIIYALLIWIIFD